MKNDYKIAILSRGYKRKTKGFLEVFETSKISEVGDEPLQIKQKFPDITVVVSENRSYAIEQLLKRKDPPIDVILMDDGYQHLAVNAGVYILLIDYNNPIYEDHLLPYGNLREPIRHKDKANIVIITNTPDNIKPIERRIIQKKLELFPYQQLFFTKVVYKSPVLVFTDHYSAVQFNFTNCRYHVLLVTGIANPKPLKENVKRFASEIEEIIYPDHYYFKEKDIKNIYEKFNKISSDKKVIITTEKDALRLSEAPQLELLKQLPVFYVPIEIDFLYNEKTIFNQELYEYVRKNQPISSVYKRKNKF